MQRSSLQTSHEGAGRHKRPAPFAFVGLVVTVGSRIRGEVNYVCYLSIGNRCRCDDYGDSSRFPRCGDAKQWYGCGEGRRSGSTAATLNCGKALLAARSTAECGGSAVSLHHSWPIAEVAPGRQKCRIKYHGCTDDHNDRGVSPANSCELFPRPLSIAGSKYATSDIRSAASGLPCHRE